MWFSRNLKGVAGVLAGAGLLLGLGVAQAETLSMSGLGGTGVTADANLLYVAANDTSATLQISVLNTTGTPPKNGAITGIALNVPTLVIGISGFSFSSTDTKAKGFSAFLNPDSVSAGDFTDFDLGITNASKSKKKSKKGSSSSSVVTLTSINGGNAKNGSRPGFEGVFTITLTGNGLANLTVNDFMSELAHGSGGEMTNLAVRFDGVGPAQRLSDEAASAPGAAVPEPGTLLLMGAGLAGMLRRFARR